jgi:hypothetical protein
MDGWRGIIAILFPCHSDILFLVIPKLAEESLPKGQLQE